MARIKKSIDYIAEYPCGCSFVGAYRELPGYCNTHGDSRGHYYRIGSPICPFEVPKGWSKK